MLTSFGEFPMTLAKLIAYSLAGGVALVSVGSNAPAAHAATFTVYNTGLGNTGNTDTNWSITSAPNSSLLGSPIIFSSIPALWLDNDGTSKWIGSNNGVDGRQRDPLGTYVYRTTFDLTGFKENTAKLVFRATSDNETTGVKLNGTNFNFTTSNTGFGAFSAPFTISSGFVAGVNTLEFTVFNSASSPSGLRVEFTESSASAVPEPLTLLGAGTALGFGALFKRKLSKGQTDSQA
jgi:hypothetical protein